VVHTADAVAAVVETGCNTRAENGGENNITLCSYKAVAAEQLNGEFF
jgi:hypothetical protein